MTFWALAMVVGFAAFAVTSATASVAVALAWRAAAGAIDGLRPAARARLLLAARLLPALASTIVVAAFVLPAFHRFEPRGQNETDGVSLAALAAAGAALVALAFGRAWRASRDTRRFVRASGGGRPLVLGGGVRASAVASRFPLVAVVGTLRPRLLVADRVLTACTPRELDAILAHESSHVRSHDNLKRMAMRCSPDVLSLTATGAALERAWMEAAEEAADDCAARAHDGGATDLALALVKVARMAPAGSAVPLHATALHHGDTIERRVRRLLAAPPPAAGVPRWWHAARGLALAAGALVVAGALDVRLLAGVQAAVELAVSTLP